MCCSTICRISSSTRWRFSRSGMAACRFMAVFSAVSSPSSALPRYASSPCCRSATSHVRLRRSESCSAASNFVNGELWGRFADVPWAMIFPRAGPIPRHPSQLYEAGLEGLVLLAVLGLMVRAGALRRPGLILGAFAALYAVMRSFSEFFRETDQPVVFLLGGMTMGMLLSVPLFIGGVLLIAFALRRQPAYP